MARFAERCRWLRVPVVIHSLTIICVLEAVGATFGVMPQVSAFPGENHLLLIAGAFAWIRALVMLVISAVVRDTLRPKGEQALKHLPRWSGVIGPLCTICELSYWLFHARHFAAGRFLAETLCYLMAAINGLLALPLQVFTMKVVWDGHAKVTPKLSTLTDPAAQLGEDISCSICLNDMTSGEQIGELPCGHIFHARCINEWLAVRPRCPLRCAKMVNPADSDQVQPFSGQGDEPEQSPSNPTPGSNSSLRRADLEFGARLAAQVQVSLPGATATSRRSERPGRASEPEFSNIIPQTVGAPASPEPELSNIMPHSVSAPSSPEPELSNVKPETIGNPSSPEHELSDIPPQGVGAPSSPEPELSDIKPETMGSPSSPEPELSDIPPQGVGAPSSPEPELSDVNPETSGNPSSPEPELSDIPPQSAGAPCSPEPELSDVKPETIGNPSSPA